MKRFHIKVIIKTLETYAVEAKDADAAEDNWYEGQLIDADDEVLENEILSVEEA